MLSNLNGNRYTVIDFDFLSVPAADSGYNYFNVPGSASIPLGSMVYPQIRGGSGLPAGLSCYGARNDNNTFAIVIVNASAGLIAVGVQSFDVYVVLPTGESQTATPGP